MQNTLWYQYSPKEIAEKLDTDLKKGLPEEDISARQKKYGKNAFEAVQKDTIWSRIIAQLKSPLVSILIIAGVGTFVLEAYLDTIVIFIAVAINIIVGVAQEGRASRAFEKLVASQETYATVVRNGKKKKIKAEDLVPGDIVIITAGSYITADMRISKNNDLLINEAALTGEWVSVSKDIEIIEKEVPVTGRDNMLWKGTLVAAGTGRGIVIATGKETELGAIAQNLAYEEEHATPLQKSIKKLAKFLALVTIVVVALILVIGLVRGQELTEMLLIGIALAVATIPEGLPAAVTVVLALGMEAILRKGGLVRNLLAAETLGSTTVILTDKTGTLTKAEMRVASLVTWHTLRGEHKNEKKSHENTDAHDMLTMALLTSDAFVEGRNEALSEWIVRGRPVERAIVLAGLESGLHQEDILESFPRKDFLPFSSVHKFVGALSEIGKSGKKRIYLTGAPEILLAKASSVYSNGGEIQMTKQIREEFEKTQKKYSAQGMRLIGVAYKNTREGEIIEDNLKAKDRKTKLAEILEETVFAGFMVLHDPLRPEVKESIKTAQEAGARIIMLTGDNPVTATTIAKEAGIMRESSKRALTGTDIQDYSDEKLLAALETTDVFARVLPEQKLRIARLLKGAGEVVAMTGDGINDAPALHSANIGIALGSGTEVAKEASDVILLNNSFSIIVHAIEEGRRILDNLKKIVTYLLSTGFSEVTIIAGALIIGGPLPLLPAQILWINILQEGFMNFAFAFEPKEDDIMKRNPSDASMKTILTPNLKKLLFIIAGVTGALLLGLYVVLLSLGTPEDQLRTIIFVALSVSSIFFSLSIKNLHRPIWRINIFSNKYLTASLGVTLAMLFVALYFPPLQKLLSLAPFDSSIIWILVLIGLVNLFIIEAAKYIIFEKKKK